MRHPAIVVDADACVPERIRADLGILTAPLDAPELGPAVPLPELRSEAGPGDPSAVAEACRRAASDHETVLYVSTAGGAEAAAAAAAALDEQTRFQHLETGAALMAAGWQAVAAAVAARQGNGLDAILAAARAVGKDASAIAMLEHPEFASVGGGLAGLLRRHTIVRLDGTAVEVLDRCARRDQALVALRDHFEAVASGEGRLRVAIHHSASEAAAEAMARWVAAAVAPEEVVVAPLTRHAAASLGPGMVGFAWYRER